MTEEAASRRASRVFLAEDHFAIALAMTSMLEELGCEVVAEAGSAAAAEQAAETVEADFAILDINLGDGTGYRAAELCHRRGIAVVFTTGYDDPPDIPAGLEKAPRLLKPVAAVDLKRTLRGLTRTA